jgi:hypothetical protein
MSNSLSSAKPYLTNPPCSTCYPSQALKLPALRDLVARMRRILSADSMNVYTCKRIFNCPIAKGKEGVPTFVVQPIDAE